jgi:hypothetical protein
MYGALFGELGYDRVIANPKRNVSAASLFKELVLARIANPASKTASRDMLEEDFGISLPLDKIYRMMDRLDDKAIQRLKEITYHNTLSLLGGKISVIFYDATTRAHIALCFSAYALVKHMEHRIRLQYKKLSPEKIRQALVRVQTSILLDKVKRIRYGLPSRLSHDARKIYDILKVKKTITPYIIKKL